MASFAAFAALGDAATDSETDDAEARVAIAAPAVPPAAIVPAAASANTRIAFMRLDNTMLGRTQCMRPTGPPTQLQAVAKAWSKALSLRQDDNLANAFLHPDQNCKSNNTQKCMDVLWFGEGRLVPGRDGRCQTTWGRKP